jgi:hypothetical protein
LQGAGLAALAPGDVEDHGMGMELRRSIAFHRSCGASAGTNGLPTTQEFIDSGSQGNDQDQFGGFFCLHR